MKANLGLIDYTDQAVSWIVDEVLLPNVTHHTGRLIIRDSCQFYSGAFAITHNKRIYKEQSENFGFMRNSSLVYQLFRHVFMLKYGTIPQQLELLSIESPASLHTYFGKMEIVLWSVAIPSGTWEVIITVVSHLISYIKFCSNTGLG